MTNLCNNFKIKEELERLNTFEWNTNKIYNNLLKDRNSISFVNNCYLIDNKKNGKICTSLNKNKQNININNNIIININNTQYDTIPNLNKTINNNREKEKEKIK